MDGGWKNRKREYFSEDRSLGQCLEAGAGAGRGQCDRQTAGRDGWTRPCGILGAWVAVGISYGSRQPRDPPPRSNGAVATPFGATGLQLLQQRDPPKRARCAYALKTRIGRHCLDRIVRPKQRRLRWPRRNGVHRYSARSQFKGPAPGEADKRRLCCGVAWRGWSLRSFRHMGYDQDI